MVIDCQLPADAIDIQLPMLIQCTERPHRKGCQASKGLNKWLESRRKGVLLCRATNLGGVQFVLTRAYSGHGATEMAEQKHLSRFLLCAHANMPGCNEAS